MIVHLALDCLHDAHLDVPRGVGLVVLPLPHHDVVLDGSSLHAAAWDHACDRLAAMGWEPRRAADTGLRRLGVTMEGRPVVEIEQVDPASDDDRRPERDLRRAAGMRV
ncbi:hypothetical protein [Nocardioides sp.]|uniref:hypothetical protein n=1 Tax=Nocardioides sp. TaxID=35761 RepID=UPI0035125DA8